MGGVLMATEWIYRITVLCPASDKAAANALWTIVAPEGDSEIATFGTPLSSDGDLPITHYGISTAATEEMRILITDVFAEDLANCVIIIEPYTQNSWLDNLAANNLQTLHIEEI